MILRGKVAIVTGAAGTIGRAIATGFATEGATLVLFDLNRPGLEEALTTLGDADPAHRAYDFDIVDSRAVRSNVEAVIQDFGCIDVLVNNAGLVFRRTLFEITEDEWDRVYGVNVKGPFLLTQAVARHMVGRGEGGKIINISSVAGKIARADKAHYASAKAALIHFTRCCAMELGPHGINVNAVCPGPTDTPMIVHPVSDDYIRKHRIVLGKIAKPEDQAAAVLFFASPAADHITGQVINVDGGEVMW